VLLAAFTAAITLSVARGRRPECHCFGQLSSKPAGGWATARNVVLGGLAAWVAVAGPGAGALDWIGDLTAAEVAQRSWGLVPGRVAPDFKLLGRDGRKRSLGSLLGTGGPEAVGPRLLRPRVRPVRRLHARAHRVRRRARGKRHARVDTRDDGTNGDIAAAERRLRHVLLQEDREVMEAYGAPGTPSGVLVDGDGMIGSQLALGADAIRSLLASAAQGRQ
jgi:hypothetical protein